jgi:ankyrin repeat protein
MLGLVTTRVHWWLRCSTDTGESQSYYIEMAQSWMLPAYHGRTPLHAASDRGIVEIARWLLDHGANPNSQEYDHSTPLHLAAAQGHLELVLTLLEHGVDLNAMNTNNRTPLHEASERGHIDIVRLLIQHGADVTSTFRPIESSVIVGECRNCAALHRARGGCQRTRWEKLTCFAYGVVQGEY